MPIPGAQDEATSQVARPGGETTSVDGIMFDRLDQLGFYRIETQENAWNVGCSLLASQETSLGNKDVVDTSQPISRGSSPAQLLTILALLIVTGESILYHRRKVG